MTKRQLRRLIREEIQKLNEANFKVGDVVYNKIQDTIGIIEEPFTKNRFITDADGIVGADELEPYDRSNPLHQKADIEPETRKKIAKMR